MLKIVLLLTLLQVPIFAICAYVLRFSNTNLIKWNVCVLMVSLIVLQLTIVVHNLRIGNVSPFYKEGVLGRFVYAASYVVMVALVGGITYFAWFCFVHPDLVRVR